MKRIVIFLIGLCLLSSAKAQFPGTDSLRNYNNKYVTNNPATAFTNLRLNTLLRGIIDFIDTARAGTGGGVALGIDTLWALNDSTIRYRKNGVFRNTVLRGVYDTRRKVDTAYALNDSTLQIKINGTNRNIVLPGRHWDLQGVLNNGSTLTENEVITLADSLTFTSGMVVIATLNLPTVTASVDTTTYKPLARGSTGDLRVMAGWPGSGSGSGSATLSNVGSGYRRVKTADGQVKTEFAGYGINKDSTTNTDAITDRVDTTTLKAVYLPLHLNGAKTVNQAGNNITFANGGKVLADSFNLTKTITPFINADSAVGVGHSIMFGSAATVTDSNYFTRSARRHSLFPSNRGVSSSIMHAAVSAHLQWIDPGHNAYTMTMGALNDVRATNILSAANRKTINYIINGLKAIWMNHMAKVVIGASDGSLTRNGAWTTGWNAASEGGKVTNGAYTSTAGNYIEYTFSDTSVGFQIMGLLSAGPSVVTVAIDGGTVETFSTNEQNDNSGGSYAPMPKFYTGLTSASHTIRVTNTSGGLMVMDYFTNLRDAITAPPICFFHEPYLDATGYSGGQASDIAIDTINNKYDSLRAALPEPWKARTIVAQTNTRYIANTSSGLSGDHVHPNDLGHGQIALSERDAVAGVISADSGTIQYGTDGYFYGDAKKIAYQNSIGLGDVINNNSVLSTPADIRGSVFEFNGFTGIGLNFFKILGNSTAYAHGALGVQGPLGGVFIGSRTGDTTKGFVYFSEPGKTSIYDTYNNRVNIITDSSLRTAFFNNQVTSAFTTPTATVHIGGNTNGVANHTPFKIGKSAWVATPEAYAWEIDSLYIGWTDGGGLRDTLATRGWARVTFGGGGADGNGIYSADGTLAGDRTVSTGGFTTTWSGANDSETSFSVTNTGTTAASAIAGNVTGSTGAGVTGTSTTGNGVVGTSSSNYGVVGTSSTTAAFRGQINVASTDAIENIVSLLRTSSAGAGANGLGAAIQFELETATSGTSQTAGRFAFSWSDATNATRTSVAEIYAVNSGTTARKAALAGNGQWTWDGYGAGSHTVTPATTPVMSSSGVVGERIAPKIYTALLTATAGNAPTATVLGTNEIGSIVWTRVADGNYTGTLSSAFTANKTWAMVQRGDMSGNFVNNWISSGSTSTVTLTVSDNLGNPVGDFTNMSIEIRVYP